MFWKALGGKADYPKMRPGEPAPPDPRLFQLSNATGALDVDEIFDFSQEDLIDEDVMLLRAESRRSASASARSRIAVGSLFFGVVGVCGSARKKLKQWVSSVALAIVYELCVRCRRPRAAVYAQCRRPRRERLLS